MESLYTTKDLASIFGVTFRTVYRWISKGTVIPQDSVVKVEGRYYFRKEIIDKQMGVLKNANPT